MKNLSAFKVIISLVVFLSFGLFQHAHLILAQSGGTWKAPEEAKKIKNPLTPSQNILKAGNLIFSQQCAVCHGKTGKGNGITAASLDPKPANLTSESVKKQTVGEIFWKIQHGRTPMPAFKKQLTEKQIWAVILYIRTLKKE